MDQQLIDRENFHKRYGHELKYHKVIQFSTCLTTLPAPLQTESCVKIKIHFPQTDKAGPEQVGKPVIMPEQMSDTSGIISWPPSTDDVDTYQVTITDSAGATRTITVPGNQTSTTVDNFTPNTSYTVTVTAVKNGAQSMPSESTPFMTKPKG